MLEDLSKMREYEDFVVDNNSEINQDMHFDSSGKHVFVMSQQKVCKLNIQTVII